MWHYLDCLSKVVAVAFLVDYILIDTSSSDIVGTRGTHVGEALVMSKIEVGLMAVNSDVTLSMLIRIECAGVNIDIGVKLLDGDTESTCLKQAGER